MNVSIQVPEPMLSIAEYAKRVGETPKVIRDDIDNKVLPFIQPKGERGKKFVNMTALLMLTIEAEEKKDEHNKVCWS
jgi:hypothetical protein